MNALLLLLSIILSINIGSAYPSAETRSNTARLSASGSSTISKAAWFDADNAIHIQYSLSQQSPVEIIITDILGNIIAQETFHESIGSHQILYEAHHLSSGAYILSIRINDTRFTQHLNIIK